MVKKKKPRSVDWAEKLLPLLKQYKGRKHPLEYQNPYQLVVMVVLAAQDSDRHINSIAPELFKAFPSMSHLSKAKPEEVFKHVETVRNFWNKTKWLISMAQTVKDDGAIPTTMEGLTNLSGIGRKSAARHHLGNTSVSRIVCEINMGCPVRWRSGGDGE